ncbi:hypothetical protein CC1G_02314 [Coprinopsis cinerea okayama7|uniref:F-box domain-containing protein n=1 Tax=Coprinopsis cinerea (strain Okayama-7 / 130 / ATCC MYA-4618 / FGSC 9003) TaxID=240176 RepID=A8N7Q7_COPC7|nr:hypothetical protein CC1G_02314 [Coprinopsis cinerea okayama7\|eukprot:XP_001830863.2 hypothetical protein CC1G_02314 [Coprinopsis cinerea okayama7\
MRNVWQSWRDFLRGQVPVWLMVKASAATRASPPALPTPPPTTIESLPAEVLDNVFSFFEGEFEELKTCSLVSPLWRSLCQPRLFRRLVLSLQDIEYSIQFTKFMLDSPHIRAAVHHVEVDFTDPWHSDRTDRRATTNRVGDILELLPRPESLKLYGPRHSDRIKWSKLPAHLRNSIKTVLRRQSLSSFLIDGWVMDVTMAELNALFAGCPSLTHLSLLEASDGLWGPTEGLPDTPRLVLEELTLSNTFAKDPKLIEWLCKPESAIDLTNLQTLHVMESRDDAAVSALLATVGSSLQRLELNISFSAENDISFKHNKNLHSLTFSFGVFYTELYNSSIPLICEVLETLPYPNNLEELTLVLYVTHPRNTNVRIFPPPPITRFNYERWAALGRLLPGVRFSSLSRVNIELIHHGIDARAYSTFAAQKMGDIGATVEWKFSRDDAPEGRAA